MPFFLIFIIIPLAEIFVFLAVSDEIGLGLALLMALATAILGGFIVKYQGIQTMMSARQSLSQGALPSKELFDGLCLVAAGATLITPGFITDAIGFALLIPKVRNTLRERLSKNAHFQAYGFDDTQSYNPPKDPSIIEAEYETLDDDETS